MPILSYITYSTKIHELVQAGIVPEWIYRDCRLHGMDTAEDFLCEWDWEWGWDLGYGYTDSQLAILKKAREIVSHGIEEFLRNPELQKQERAKEDARKKAELLYSELTKKLCPPFYVGEISRVVNHVMKYGEEPLFMIFYCWFKRHRHSDRNKIRFFMAGVYDGNPHTPKETFTLQSTGELKEKYGIETEFSLRSLQRSAKTPIEIKGRLSYLIPALKLQLAEYVRQAAKREESLREESKNNTAQSADTATPILDTLTDSVWEAIKHRENITFDPATLLRPLHCFLQE